ncbi:response regulator containing a CheY-like receiver domain and an HTH DNA-binding domain [Saccharomonospora marina XMU15]|uniref:Response regulator containing a CheY-like receiver domain and an HTH DNA-binding domain n=1 Tax=Saccharomonospora marina XMU15 TaxID=882083 RepID=H5WYW0_9PSEU|nr:response regulator transcription factor [Saccharomonospora marina]EHR51832.1 response regulator containing a CheY-like receiver domain and an HTH DNA-binding domain [Saccharomonospora marina XMU15]
MSGATHDALLDSGRREGARPIRVLIVDDHAVVRRGLRAYLDVIVDVEVVGEAADGEQALREIDAMAAYGEAPDVVLLDLLMPKLDGIATISRINDRHPGVGVVVLTSFGEIERVRAALTSGACGYLLKDAEPGEVVAAIRAAAGGEMFLDPAVARQLTNTLVSPGGEAATLTRRELEVLALVAKGQSNQEIADELYISERTARTHVSNVLRKLGLTSRTQAAVVAVQRGLVPPPHGGR